MNKEFLAKVGVACFGNTWQTDLAKALTVNNRTVRRWASGETPIPQNIKNELLDLIKAREIELDEVKKELMICTTPSHA